MGAADVSSGWRGAFAIFLADLARNTAERTDTAILGAEANMLGVAAYGGAAKLAANFQVAISVVTALSWCNAAVARTTPRPFRTALPGVCAVFPWCGAAVAILQADAALTTTAGCGPAVEDRVPTGAITPAVAAETGIRLAASLRIQAIIRICAVVLRVARGGKAVLERTIVVGATLIRSDAAIGGTAPPTLRTALSRDRAELPRIRAAQLFAVADPVAAGVVAALSMVRPRRITRFPGAARRAARVGCASRTGAYPTDRGLLAGAFDRGGGWRGPPRRSGAVGEQSAGRGCSAQPQQPFQELAAIAAGGKRTSQSIEVPIVHISSLEPGKPASLSKSTAIIGGLRGTISERRWGCNARSAHTHPNEPAAPDRARRLFVLLGRNFFVTATAQFSRHERQSATTPPHVAECSMDARSLRGFVHPPYAGFGWQM